MRLTGLSKNLRSTHADSAFYNVRGLKCGIIQINPFIVGSEPSQKTAGFRFPFRLSIRLRQAPLGSGEQVAMPFEVVDDVLFRMSEGNQTKFHFIDGVVMSVSHGHAKPRQHDLLCHRT